MKMSKLIGKLLVILISIVAFAGLSYAQGAEGGEGGPTDIWVGQVNINSASVEEIQQVPGMDNELSSNIVEFREVNGPFSSINDLLKVEGLSENKLESIKGYLSVEGETTLEHIYP